MGLGNCVQAVVGEVFREQSCGFSFAFSLFPFFPLPLLFFAFSLLFSCFLFHVSGFSFSCSTGISC